MQGAKGAEEQALCPHPVVPGEPRSLKLVVTVVAFQWDWPHLLCGHAVLWRLYFLGLYFLDFGRLPTQNLSLF